VVKFDFPLVIKANFCLTTTTMKKRAENVGILGYGEVGQAIAKFYRRPKVRDLNRNDGLKDVEILHVCIPDSERFVSIVKKEINKIKPKLTIIHSTVAPGTTKKIGGNVVHSPVRGIHPKLYEGLKTFVKYIGTDNQKAGQMAKKHLESLGIKTRVFTPSTTTELGKLLDTAYYGLCIAFHGEMKRMCDTLHVNFDTVVTAFNSSYNQGYTKLGMPHVIRPVLRPPNPVIGGHCIIPNVRLLKKSFKSKAFDLILTYRPRKKK